MATIGRHYHDSTALGHRHNSRPHPRPAHSRSFSRITDPNQTDRRPPLGQSPPSAKAKLLQTFPAPIPCVIFLPNKEGNFFFKGNCKAIQSYSISKQFVSENGFQPHRVVAFYHCENYPALRPSDLSPKRVCIFLREYS